MTLQGGVIVIGDLSDKAAAFVHQVSVESPALMVYDPMLIPVGPFCLWPGDRSAPGVVIGHGFFIGQEPLPKPQVLMFWFIQGQHGVSPIRKPCGVGLTDRDL